MRNKHNLKEALPDSSVDWDEGGNETWDSVLGEGGEGDAGKKVVGEDDSSE